MALEGIEPLTGSPLWVQINPVLKAARSGARITAFAGPPVATAGARVVLERKVGGTWRGVDRATVSRLARANLSVPSVPGALQVRLTPTDGSDQQQNLMISPNGGRALSAMPAPRTAVWAWRRTSPMRTTLDTRRSRAPGTHASVGDH